MLVSSMKKCSYCGRENVDHALQCSECGTKDFNNAPQTKASSHLVFRFLASLGSAWCVTAIALFVAWQNYRGDDDMSVQRYVTRMELRHLQDAVDDYRHNFGSVPVSIQNLRGAKQELDGWGHPFLYVASGTNYLITSLGRDNRPGGKGLDCDLTNRDPFPSASALTLKQFFFDIPNGGIIASCFLAGAASFVLMLVLVRRPDFTRSGLLKFFIKLAFTVAGTVMTAVLIAGLHLPVKHH
jgi:Type II secretion system (T2SS), protein G/zinc-ribbon domain